MDGARLSNGLGDARGKVRADAWVELSELGTGRWKNITWMRYSVYYLSETTPVAYATQFNTGDPLGHVSRLQGKARQGAARRYEVR